jgi:DNA polymerase III subunit delta
LEELGNDLQSAGPRPVYAIMGPEKYLCRQAIDLLKRTVLSPDGLSFDYAEFSAGAVPVNHIIDAANTFPMLAKRRFVLVLDVDDFKDSEQDTLLDLLPSLSPRGLLVLLADSLDHRKKFYRTLREKYCIAEFEKLKGFALEQWTEEFVRKSGYRISASAIKKIVEAVGSDQQTLVNELEKLFLYAGKEKNIPEAILDDLVRSSRQYGIFELIDAIGLRNRVGALRSLANLLSMGEHPLVIVTMMARHCRQMLMIKEALRKGANAREAGSAAQIPPFKLDQYLRQARVIEESSVQEMFTRLADLDRRLKSSSADGRIGLEQLICALI